MARLTEQAQRMGKSAVALLSAWAVPLRIRVAPLTQTTQVSIPPDHICSPHFMYYTVCCNIPTSMHALRSISDIQYGICSAPRTALLEERGGML